VTRGDIHERVLAQRAEHKQQTRRHPDIDGFDVGDSREIGVDADAVTGRGEDREETEGDAGRCRVHTDPEGDPREADDEHARHEHVDHEESDLAAEDESHFQA